jgi:aspartyl-tRNA(Asn)/glutamyl-tRNA(Gln) amidotransferase subunit A
MTDLARMPATRMAEAFRAGTLSPVEALKAVLTRLDAVEPTLNAFVHVDRHGAMMAACAAEARYRDGAALGPLDGVPVSVKDMLPTSGMPTRKGSRTTDPDAPQDADAPAAARARAGGMVLYGKTTTTEFGGSPYSTSPLTGDTHSPWNTNYGCAGSSMGAAAQLAAGVGTLAIANDASGSIRMPASFGGVFGLKPTFGMVATWPSSSAGILGHTGPMGWNVEDTTALLGVIAGPDRRDPYALPRQDAVLDGNTENGLAGLRIAYSPTLGLVDPDPDVRAATDSAAAVFATLGATVEEVDPDFSGLFQTYDCLRISFRAASYRAAGAGEKRGEMDELVARVLDQSRAFSADDFIAALRHREVLAARMQQFHETYDLLLTPTLAVPPQKLGTKPGPKDDHWYQIDGRVWSPYCFGFNLTQQPAASIPCGLTGADSAEAPGLPIGLQIVGARFRDDLVLRAARAFEMTRDWSYPEVRR